MYGTSNTVITLLGQMHMLAAQLGLPESVNNLYQETTLNNILGINDNIDRLPGTSRKAEYFGIGIGGSSYTTTTLNSETVNSLSPYHPSEKNMNLFKPIPVMVVPAGTAVDPDLYRMKETRTFGTDPTEFDVYWLKKCSLRSNDGSETYVQSVSGDTDLRTAYVVNNPATVGGLRTPTASNDLISVENIVIGAILECVLTGSELANVITYYLDGRSDLAIISEYGIYAGAERLLASTVIDSVETQLVMHRCLRGHDISAPQTRVTEQFALENGGSIIAKSW